MSRSAHHALEKIGVTPMLGHTVSDVGVRSIERAAGLVDVGRAQGVDVQLRGLDALVQIARR